MAKFPDWHTFSERPGPEDSDLLSPAAEVAALLQQQQAALAAAGKAEEQAKASGIKALVQQAVFVYRFEAALKLLAARLEPAVQKKLVSLRIIKDQMRDALQQEGIEIEDLLGKAYDEVAEHVEVQGWLHRAEFTSEVVAEVRIPVITYQGAIVQSGVVVMGAPTQSSEEQIHTSSMLD
ncbi:hypothetical protein EPA93_38130 [Ktedonosporobacter rubrisoli]|uniref:Nucleotide exchange factor GrpE n=1 Tax=Ktedonosporobacter rubrisoli TaxID=2509675 RepID=A0A4P6K0B0_KTERU|nr:hypothetical protein [Ktedonosporobacter rubrisoli]QBD81479.1 hypothetical protein EPA93_38130 [Ktedonosporobacter rubrisoli]